MTLSTLETIFNTMNKMNFSAYLSSYELSLFAEPDRAFSRICRSNALFLTALVYVASRVCSGLTTRTNVASPKIISMATLTLVRLWN